jgi:hypothetical protein
VPFQEGEGMDNGQSFDMKVNIPKNEDEAISSGEDLGRSIYTMTQQIALEMFNKGVSPYLIDNSHMHALIVALSYMLSKMAIHMEAANGEDMKEYEEKFKAYLKTYHRKVVDAVHEILTSNMKGGTLIKVDKTEEDKKP